MKEKIWAVTLVFGMFLAETSLFASGAQSVEVMIQTAFIPKVGFDDNDPVQVVVAGQLPSPCYTLGAAFFEKKSDNKTFILHQLAYLDKTSHCASGDLIDDPVFFTSEIQLGQLPAAEYTLKYKQDNGSVATREFVVEKAKISTLDNFNYAMVSNIEMEQIYGYGEEVKVTLSGVIRSTCMDLVAELPTTKVDDAYVVLPIVKSNQKTCEIKPRNFKKVINLGRVPLGSYLLHVRSRNGQAVNMVFEVLTTE